MSAKQMNTSTTVVSLAVTIGRQPPASVLSATAVADEATRFYVAACRVLGTATPPPGAPDAHAATLQAMADRWGARVVLPRDPHGCTVGLIFQGRHTSGMTNVFFVC